MQIRHLAPFSNLPHLPLLVNVAVRDGSNAQRPCELLSSTYINALGRSSLSVKLNNVWVVFKYFLPITLGMISIVWFTAYTHLFDGEQ